MIKKPKRKPAKVISIDRTALKSTSDLRVIALDPESNRMIITICRERNAYDMTTPDYPVSVNNRRPAGAGGAAEARVSQK